MSRIKHAVLKSGCIQPNEQVIVGFSGGADSLTLLHVLHSMGVSVIACHVNHGLRGAESDADEALARTFCEVNAIPFEVLHTDIRSEAAKRGVGEEEAGRMVRYTFFEEMRERYHADKIATAHTMSDQAETVLYHLVRGSGMKGLTGIPAQRGCIIRPLLTVSREEIEAYCKENSLVFAKDSTNTDAAYARNRIRHETLPSLKAIRPNAEDAIAKTAAILSEEEQYLESQTARAFAEVMSGDAYDADVLKNLPKAIQRRVAQCILKRECGEADFASCEAMLHLITLPTGQITVHGKTVFTVRKNRLLCERSEPIAPFETALLIGGETEICGLRLKTEIVKPEELALSEKVYKKLLYLALDYDTIKGEIHVRQRKDGDRIAFAQRGVTKPLKKWFSEAGLTAVEKANVMVFADTEQLIGVWGFGTSREHAVTPNTERVLLITITD